MKKSLVAASVPTLDRPIVTRSFPNDLLNQKQAQDALRSVRQPTEETLIRLNQIGQEYPFCVYYKQKMNDPL